MQKKGSKTINMAMETKGELRNAWILSQEDQSVGGRTKQNQSVRIQVEAEKKEKEEAGNGDLGDEGMMFVSVLKDMRGGGIVNSITES